MPEAFVRARAHTLADWRRLWSFTADPYRTVRRRTREVRVGDVGIGGSNPVRIQSMTIADTLDTPAVVEEIVTLARAGCEIVRVTAPNRTAAENLGAIRAALRARDVHVPLVADVHFTPQAAWIAAAHVDKVRINPGNFADRKHFKKWEYTDAEYAEELDRLEAAFRPLVERCKERGVAMRIGTNHGSLSDRILNRYGDTPLGMVESALEFVRICENHGYRDIVLSMKASDVKVMLAAYRLLAQRLHALGMDYPLHLGVTEAGGGLSARVKSAIGIATLLADGLGDTIRVSLTEDSVHELPVARALAAHFAAAPMASPAQAAPPTRLPPWDPCFFTRRTTATLGAAAARLGADQPPRLEMVRHPPAPHEDLAAWLGGCVEADLVLVTLASPTAEVLRALAARLAPWPHRGRPAFGVEIPWAALADAPIAAALHDPIWERVSLVATGDAMPPIDLLQAVPVTLPVQCTVSAAMAPHIAALAPPPAGAALALLPAPGPGGMLHAWRAVLAAQPATDWPLVLRGPAPGLEGRVDAHIDARALHTAWEIGGLVADGVGDAVQFEAGPEPTALELGREILQATRARLTKADFIACPSCGRTQFDLQSTTARIESRLRHLKGLKIAVMGCIVNGPGEMADADFGYVGSGPGRIDLYVGHERVERNVPEADAVARLVDLIRRHGRWVEPDAGTD